MKRTLGTLLLGTLLLGTLLLGTALLAAPASAEDLKIGILFGFTGPIESLTPPMADGAELAMKEAAACC